MNIDRNMLFSYDMFNSCCAKQLKKCIFRHEFYTNFSKLQFHDNMDENSIYVQNVGH